MLLNVNSERELEQLVAFSGRMFHKLAVGTWRIVTGTHPSCHFYDEKS